MFHYCVKEVGHHFFLISIHMAKSKWKWQPVHVFIDMYKLHFCKSFLFSFGHDGQGRSDGLWERADS